MDNDTFSLLSQITVKGRAAVGAIHPAKLLTDPSYAEEVFLKIDQSDDPALIMLSLQLREKLGHMEIKERKVDNKAKKLETETDDLPAQKYVFGARG